MGQAIYVPTGRAREYAELALNLYRGCSHRCTYCYVPAVLRTTMAEWATDTPQPKKDILKHLERDAAKLAEAGDTREILLCFTSDPYHGGCTTLTREALRILGEHGLRATVLTKGGMRALRDFDLMAKYGFRFGATMTSPYIYRTDATEPGAPATHERVEAIKQAHTLGIKTWVSLEPVIWPDDSLTLIETNWDGTDMHSIVDYWRVGKLNHDPAHEATIDWAKFYVDVTTLLDSVGADYYIKDDLREFAPEG